ncbi:MAG: ABC transporter permease subunit [Chloroflexota bacterium]
MNNFSDEHKVPFYRDERWLQNAAQVISVVVVVGIILFIRKQFLSATEARGLVLSFDFLDLGAGFPISEAHIPYDPSMSLGRAFMVGLVNTLLVSVFGIVLATILGTLVALGRVSSNWLMNKAALIFVEFHRNIPLLVLLYIWYFTVFQNLPNVKESIILGDDLLVINQRGFFLTWPRLTETGSIFMISIGIAVVVAYFAYTTLRKKREVSGVDTYYGRISLGILIVVPLIGWFAADGTPFVADVPVLDGFNFKGGQRITPEFLGLLVALVTYTAGFIAEVVRAGLQAVHKGQQEAAQAVGLNYFQVLNLIIMPQALRIIIPPMISQYLNLTKNSSLALIIGYQDLFAVSKITINNAGRAVPVFVLTMGSYLILSLLTSFVLNLYNRRIQLVTR